MNRIVFGSVTYVRQFVRSDFFKFPNWIF